jgi:hypothetical protein
MNSSSLAKFVALRSELVIEKATLEARLVRINQVLGSSTPAPAKPAKPAVPAVISKPKKARKKLVLAKNKISMKAAVLQVTKDKPLNSLGVTLYNRKVMKNGNGKFSPVK